MSEHIVRAFGEELNHLAAEVARMGGLAEAQVSDAVDTVTRRDVNLAQSVIERVLQQVPDPDVAWKLIHAAVTGSFGRWMNARSPKGEREVCTEQGRGMIR